MLGVKPGVHIIREDRAAWDTKAGTVTLEQSVLSLLPVGDHRSLDTILHIYMSNNGKPNTSST